MSEIQRLTETVPEELAGLRLDQALAALFPAYSRARLTRWVKEGQVLVDGERRRPRDPVHGGETVALEAEQEVETRWRAQAIPLDIVHEDEAVIVIHKPAGLVVHPGAGNMDGTLSNALLHHDPALELVPRAGVVHRLDKDTSGLLVIARTLAAQKSLVEQLQARAFEREYLALVNGVMTAGGTVEAPVGRHPTNRLRQAVVPGGREAITHYRVEERYRGHSLLRVRLETGRTHQIRVHMAYLKHPLVGDPVYGGRLRLPAGATPGLVEALRGFRRQALHAERLGFAHPLTGEHVSWQAPLPEDMAALIEACREDAREA